tara:strand:- start:604 stop:1263 length:660 start_codon:yes stop_codon:yes gene_type:complete
MDNCTRLKREFMGLKKIDDKYYALESDQVKPRDYVLDRIKFLENERVLGEGLEDVENAKRGGYDLTNSLRSHIIDFTLFHYQYHQKGFTVFELYNSTAAAHIQSRKNYIGTKEKTYIPDITSFSHIMGELVVLGFFNRKQENSLSSSEMWNEIYKNSLGNQFSCKSLNGKGRKMFRYYITPVVGKFGFNWLRKSNFFKGRTFCDSRDGGFFIKDQFVLK